MQQCEEAKGFLVGVKPLMAGLVHRGGRSSQQTESQQTQTVNVSVVICHPLGIRTLSVMPVETN